MLRLVFNRGFSKFHGDGLSALALSGEKGSPPARRELCSEYGGRSKEGDLYIVRSITARSSSVSPPQAQCTERSSENHQAETIKNFSRK